MNIPVIPYRRPNLKLGGRMIRIILLILALVLIKAMLAGLGFQ